MTGQTPRLWTVLRCKERDFQQFLGVDSEEAAARAVKRRLKIQSRKELDQSAAAIDLFDGMRRDYLNYQKQHPTNHQ